MTVETAVEEQALARAGITDRAARARAVLAHAERRTGARSLTVSPVSPAPAVPAPVPTVSQLTTSELTTSELTTSLLTTERPPLPVPPALAPVLPDGLRRGATTVVLGSTSLVLALLAHACAGGAWAALVGQPAVGLLAAAQAGVALERLAVVPAPGPDAALVVAALVDGLDVVLVGPQVVLTDVDRRRLSARARERGAVLLSTAPWVGAGAVLEVEPGRWAGVGAGEGYLRTHEVTVLRSGRGSAAVPRSVELTLPLPRPGEGPVPDGTTTLVRPARTGLRLVG
ncbi:hypothetical protein [Cellulomonas soli]|uniref:Uncharacterized protein n=1 Tax=Cellulomonas soli TaxID=931535 RepID=A0A512PH84_9CELL|nr:hypothetical protein [Cellulomonas soli]NYI60855.1 hypothetical protein [Cellulomonas soli]GEP70561.1 hypothetical protein CSO01_32760 [Cellulomonas soli]